MTPQERTAHVLKGHSFVGGTVEMLIRIPGGRTFRRDFIGCVDQIFVRGAVTLAIQSTTLSNSSARIQKSIDVPALTEWLSGNHRAFEVWGWRKLTRGLPRPRWMPQITRVVLNGDALDIQVDVPSLCEPALAAAERLAL